MSDSDIKIDLSGIKMDKRCKVCKMSIWNMQLFLAVHELRIVKGASAQQVQKFVNMEISDWNKMNPSNGQEFISDTSIGGHFSKHVPAQLALNAKIKQSLNGSQFAKEYFPPGTEKALTKMGDGVDQANLDEMGKFHTLVGKVSARFEQFDKALSTEGKLDPQEISAFKALAELLGKLHKDVIQLRNQDKILQTALTSVLDTFTINATEQLMGGIEMIIEDFQKEFKTPTQAAMCKAKLQTLLATSMITSAKSALATARQSMKAG
jgi:hypothetical protein